MPHGEGQGGRETTTSKAEERQRRKEEQKAAAARAAAHHQKVAQKAAKIEQRKAKRTEHQIKPWPRRPIWRHRPCKLLRCGIKAPVKFLSRILPPSLEPRISRPKSTCGVKPEPGRGKSRRRNESDMPKPSKAKWRGMLRSGPRGMRASSPGVSRWLWQLRAPRPRIAAFAGRAQRRGCLSHEAEG